VRSAVAYLDSEADKEWIASIAEPTSLLKSFLTLKFMSESRSINQTSHHIPETKQVFSAITLKANYRTADNIGKIEPISHSTTNLNPT
jgi:hypothetical protein